MKTSALFALILFGFSSLAQAQSSQVNASLAATCFSCHGPGGVSKAAIPGLAGRSADSIVTAMLEYKAGKRPGTIMPQIAKGYTDEQIQHIAAYFAAQKN
jgi:cytochrome c553